MNNILQKSFGTKPTIPMKKSTEPARYDKYDPNLSSDEDDIEFE